jgi:hypothetical protein
MNHADIDQIQVRMALLPFTKVLARSVARASFDD